MPSAVASIAGSAVTGLVGGIFGRKSRDRATGFLTTSDAALRNTPATGFTSTGGTATFRRDAGTGVTSFAFNRARGVDRALENLRNQGTFAARNFSALRSRVASGFSSLRQARFASLREAERRSVGSLRESLRQRRLGGSSFENLAISEERERFARLADEIGAETGIAELGIERQLIDDEFRASLTGLAETLQQFNFETQVVASLSNSANALAGTVANARAGLAQAAANVSIEADTGIGETFAPLVDAIAGGVSDIATDIFAKPGGGTAGGVA